MIFLKHDNRLHEDVANLFRKGSSRWKKKKKRLKEVEVVAEGANETGLLWIHLIWPYLTDGKRN